MTQSGRSSFLTRRHVVAVGAIFLAVELAMFVFVAAGTYGLVVPLAGPTTTDFVSFYAAGSLATAGTPQLAYDKTAHYRAEERATARGITYNFFYYPPVYLMLCAILARLPYLLAFVGFEITTLICYLLVAGSILADGALCLVPVVAFPPVFWTIGLGQNAFLTAALFGAGTLLTDRRPVAAGLLFGGLCYKPHFALLVPVALIAGRHWRTLAAAATAAATLCAASLLLFGWPVWRAFLNAAIGSPGVYQSGRVALGGFVTPFGAVLLLDGRPLVAYAVQAVATLAAAALVAIVWRRPQPLPIRAAVLAAATLVAVPLAIVYDLLLGSIAGLWLLRADTRHRLGVRGAWGLAGLAALSLDPRSLAEHWHVPVGPIISLGFFVLVAAIALRGEPVRRPTPSAAPAGSARRGGAPVLLQPGRAQTRQAEGLVSALPGEKLLR